MSHGKSPGKSLARIGTRPGTKSKEAGSAGSRAVLDSFDRGKTIERHFETVEGLVMSRGRLRTSEKALRKLLRQRAA
jgi:hypothetical protein